MKLQKLTSKNFFMAKAGSEMKVGSLERCITWLTYKYTQ